jgi:hypothetical protein
MLVREGRHHQTRRIATSVIHHDDFEAQLPDPEVLENLD